jgi:ATP-dependent helicase/nuclease subunit A
MSPLNIYKASAGSGKTFAITLEYLKLLFQSPGIHRNILAVTFTNKAAGEMKARILNLLFDLSKYDGTRRREEMGLLSEALKKEEPFIRSRAGELLQIILNDYTGFSVGTIDKFFQSVIRAFTREIGIQPGYNLELDSNRVLSLAVDNLFNDLANDDALQKWLIRFAEERLEESRSWNFRNEIMELGMQLFRESFQGLFLESGLEVLSKKNLELYLNDIRALEKESREKMSVLGKEALAHINRAGLQVEDFRLKGKSPPSMFRMASEMGDLQFTAAKIEAIDEAEKWFKKDASQAMVALTEELLMPLLGKLYQQQKVLNTLLLIRKNFYTLGIMGDLWEHVRAYTKERNLFLIADSSRFLKGIIGGNQVPFIYERTGGRFSHIMLDEFQDTSVFQYDNFKPLLDNSLASGQINMVVGDVKQSIYRWRNSDWKILASDLDNDFRHQECFTHTLNFNYRSSEQIIRFNNTVFQLAPRELARIIEKELISSGASRTEADREILRFKSAYADAVQQFPEKNSDYGGMVRMEVIKEEENRSFNEQVLERIPGWIEEIGKAGVEPGQTAILVRNRKEGVAVANTLLEYAKNSEQKRSIRLISNESLLLIHNSSISLLLSVLRFMVYPDDQLNRALLKYHSFLTGNAGQPDLNHLFEVSLPLESFLPETFFGELARLKQLPLFELTESLIAMFKLGDRMEDLPYLQAFQDVIIDLQRRDPIGIRGFLQHWEQHGSKKGISVSEESNAIRILTIHKAKGLEFKAVLVPFCNWEITTDQRKSNILWCETQGTPMERIPIVPVRFGSKMQHTLFSKAYFTERMRGYMDSLNLMYVAFTRAKEMLYLGIPGTEEEKISHTGGLIRAILDQVPDQEPALKTLNTYVSGDGLKIGDSLGCPREAVPEEPWKFENYPVHQGIRSLKVRMRGEAYFVDEEGVFRTERMYGNMMHLVFSRIISKSDVTGVVRSFQREGLLPEEECEPLKQSILEVISRPGIEEWFLEKSGRVIHSERNLYCKDGKVLRPDRVIEEGEQVTVVDFKFGMQERPAYQVQVRNYMEYLSQLGYKVVQGYLWYVMMDKTVKIEWDDL